MKSEIKLKITKFVCDCINSGGWVSSDMDKLVDEILKLVFVKAVEYETYVRNLEFQDDRLDFPCWLGTRRE